MPRDTSIWFPGYIFIPTANYELSWKITITDDNDVVHDVTSYVISLEIAKDICSISSASIVLSNPDGFFLNKFNGGEKIDIYMEYANVVNPTTKVFTGKLDSILFNLDGQGYTASIISRHIPELYDTKIVEQFTNALCSDAIKQIIDNNYAGLLTYNNVTATPDDRVTATYSHISGIEAIYDILKRTNLVMYIDTDNDLHTFEKGSVMNEDYDINYNSNLMSLSGYGKDHTKVLNRIWVYGKTEENIMFLDRKDDLSSQSNLWIKDEIINDSSLLSMEETTERAEVELDNKSTVENSCSVTTLGMPSVEPGQSIYLYVPYCGADEYHVIFSVNHRLDAEAGFTTLFNLESKPTDMTELFKQRIDVEQQLRAFENLNAMRAAYTITFEEVPEKVSHNNTEVVGGILQLISGPSTGICTSATVDVINDVTQCELRIKANDDQQLCTYEVSNDGGITWDLVEPGYENMHTFTSVGHLILFRVNMDNGGGTHNPKFEAISLLYK
jgi:hypothetical protein